MTVAVPTVSLPPLRELLLKSKREEMDIVSAYQQVGSYRAVAVLCGTTHKTVKRVIARREGGQRPVRRGRVTTRACARLWLRV